MEEDIKVVEEFVERYKGYGFYGIIKKEKIEALERIVLDYKQKLNALDKNEKFIKELGKEIDRLQEENRELMKLKENHDYSVDVVRQNTKLRYELFNSIPKEKIEEIIKKLDIDIERNKRRKSEHNTEQDTDVYSSMLIVYEPETIKRILQELLKDGGK